LSIEVLIKGWTRHKDEQDSFYFKDWTAGDILDIKPEGYYTSMPNAGWKKWGCVFVIDAQIQIVDQIKLGAVWEFPGRIGEHGELDEGRMMGRSQYVLKFGDFLTTQQEKDIYNPDVLVEPIVLSQSYLDLFRDRSERAVISPWDTHSTFDNETVDVGPTGHIDANTFFEFESNIAATLTGPVIGDADEAFSETATVVINGTTTTASNYIEFKTSGAGRHDGSYDNTAARLEVTDGHLFSIEEDYVRFTGIQGQVTRTNTVNTYGFRHISGLTGDIQISYCIAKGVGGESYAVGANDAYYSGGGGTLKFWNCIAHGFKSSGGTKGRAWYCNGPTYNIYNCTSSDNDTGFQQLAGTANATNCASFNNADDFKGTWNTIDYCASDDGDGTNAEDFTAEATDWNKVFTDYTTDDYSLLNYTTNPCCVGEGTDNPGSGLYSDDIIGTARSSPWDIGAFEYTSGAGFSPNVDDDGRISDVPTMRVPRMDTALDDDGRLSENAKMNLNVHVNKYG
jgi:hypothetical protein